MRLLVTGGSGVLGRPFIAAARAAGHDVVAPAHGELDLLDAEAVRDAVQGADAILHLATRIPPRERMGDPAAWEENDRLRRDATELLCAQAFAARTPTFVLPTITFVYPVDEPVDEGTPVRDDDLPANLRSALDAERATGRLAGAGLRAVVLRLGLLDGPGTGNDAPVPDLGATLHVDDAADALLLALDAPTGIYNVCRDGERVANARFRETTGWRPRR